MTEKERNEKEMKNLFEDPKYARNAFKEIGFAIANRPPIVPIQEYDRNGIETADSMIQTYAYENLKKDIDTLGKPNREPTELEMIMSCQMVKARTDTSAAVFIRDTLGAKPVDETKLDAKVANPYDTLTDEELELIVAHRKEQERDA